MSASPPPLSRLGGLATRRRRAVLVVGAILFAIAAAIGAGAQSALSLSRFEAPGSESDRAEDVLREEFGDGSPNFLLLVTAKEGTVDDAAVADAGRALTEELAEEPLVTTVGSYWTRGNTPTLASEDRTQALVVAWLAGDATEVREELADVSPEFTRDEALITVQPGGQDEIFRQVSDESRQDFLRAEAVIIPVVLVLLVWAYRRWSAAGLTLGVGLFSVLATLAILRGVTAFVEVSTFAANLALVLGLGLGIDYSLFVIARFREESAAGRDKLAAAARTVETAGRTVLFSGITVAASLAALFAFPFPFLQSFAYGGIAVVLTAAFGAVVLLPAALAAVGHRVLRPRPPATTTDVTQGRWYRSTLRVMRRPLLYGLPVLVVLLALGAPFLGAQFGLPDERVLPADAASRVTQEQIRENFPTEVTDGLQIVATGVDQPTGAATDEYAALLSEQPGVFQVDAPTGSYVDGTRVGENPAEPGRFATDDAVRLTVVADRPALEGDMTELVADIRAVDAPYDVLVGGFPAAMTDFREALLDRLPLVVAIILVVTFVIIFLMTGSVLIPAKATVANVLSLTVMFGSLVWVFQDGNLSGLLDFTPAGRMEPSIPILMFCIAYGLSMDYEVFIMARVKEEYDRTGDNTAAVAAGIQRSAPLITAAAGILALTFAAYVTGSVVFLKQLGVGMALAVLVDALLIRTVLVPAAMRLAGDANWWAPGPLRRLHERFGLREAGPAEPAPTTSSATLTTGAR
ncbi:MMPL family transporter [Streptomyces millisiae]|uniref:MMPL family transporter n=1 Tax=Streptomyces millisiae TaxID=3075542 RepID=A0ABU2LSM0_9ACTN|nr:MMPL family transporter [Streptomyces sp. DSM 44918]MDT0320053.1 MMPL family transporter [Streptomyces sp. DSM 44918]